MLRQQLTQTAVTGYYLIKDHSREKGTKKECKVFTLRLTV